jgi:MYXO-CTERM domain-containing protein
MPNDYGSVYVGLSLIGREADTGVTVSFDGDAAVRWNVDVLLVRPDGTAEVRTLDTASSEPTLLLDELDEFAKAVLVVSNLSDGDHDPDNYVCGATAPFSYSFELTELPSAPDPTNPVDPSEPAEPAEEGGGAQTVSGCGCTLPGDRSKPSNAGWPALLLALALGARRVRRRRRCLGGSAD